MLRVEDASEAQEQSFMSDEGELTDDGRSFLEMQSKIGVEMISALRGEDEPEERREEVMIVLFIRIILCKSKLLMGNKLRSIVCITR